MSETNSWILIDSSDSSEISTQLPESVPAGNGQFRLNWGALRGGKREGVQLLIIDTGKIRMAILPTRGMGIWKCWAGNSDLELGWQSPVKGPVHPMWVPIFDPSGIGWLDGFDEFLVRCGLESNGAPEFAPNGTLKYPLHGRIANLPAHKLKISIDPLAGTLDVRASVEETRFLIRGLTLDVHMQFKVDQAAMAITDTVTNHSSRSTTMQLLYHINVGQPLLEAGSRVHAMLKKISPRNDHSAASIDQWSVYQPPTEGFAEQVYFGEAASDSSGWSTALLTDSRSENGLAVRYDVRTLPYFNLWKNTAAVEDGYVTGLEPATGFPNPRSFEEANGRLVTLAAGASKSFRLQLLPLLSADEVASVASEIPTSTETTLSAPDPHWAS